MEPLANFGEFIGTIAVVLSLVYVGYQLSEARKQARADTLQRRMDTRINIWAQALDREALNSAREKYFEFELYKVDELPWDIEELDVSERRALNLELLIELVYFDNLFYQRKHGLIEKNDSLPLDYMNCFRNAPQRRLWKDNFRGSDHFPPDFVAHADAIVKKYDRVERRMDEDQDADFNATLAEVFDIPAPPPWV